MTSEQPLLIPYQSITVAARNIQGEKRHHELTPSSLEPSSPPPRIEKSTTLGDIASKASVKGRPGLYLVFEGGVLAATTEEFARKSKKASDFYLTNAISGPDVEKKYVARVELTAEGDVLPVLAGAGVTSSDIFPWLDTTNGRFRIFFPDFYVGPNMLPGLMRMVTPPILPQTVRALVPPDNAPTKTLVATVAGRFDAGFVASDFTIKPGTALYHSTAYIGRMGYGSHTNLDGGKLVAGATPINTDELESLTRAYPMGGVFVLSTRRSVRPDERDGVTYGKYFLQPENHGA